MNKKPILPDDGKTLQDFLPTGASGDGTARAGSPLPQGQDPAAMATIEAALKTVYDPEISVNIHDLGLIYRVSQDPAGDVDIDMTLTSPMCPVAGSLPQEVAEKVAAVDGVGQVCVALVWDPPWSRESMSEEARLLLDLF